MLEFCAEEIWQSEAISPFRNLLAPGNSWEGTAMTWEWLSAKIESFFEGGGDWAWAEHFVCGVQAHLKADSFYSVVANMRGSSAEEVAGKILSSSALRGLQVRLLQ